MSKKDYKKGMADALAANEGFSKKQEAALGHVSGEIMATAKKVDKLGDKIGEITGYITDQEKAALYKLNTPVDIADLENNEKRVLLAVLYQLSADEEELTEAQQNYVRAVQQYLKIYNPQTEIDLEAVENIEDVAAQKAILQVVLEFFYLGTHPKSYTEDQIDFLDCFQVNRKTRKEISGYVEAIIATAGIQGLAEKYGFVAQQPKSEFATYTDNGPIPEAVADAFVREVWKTRGLSFKDNLPFLELKDYLVFASYAGDDKTDRYRFSRMDKRTGQVTELPVNDKDFSFPKYGMGIASIRHLSFHMRGNVLYLMWEGICLEHADMKYVHPIEIDVEKLTCRDIPIKFYGKDFNSQHIPYFHLSGDGAQLVVYAFNNGYGTQQPYSKIYVADLTQDRVFQIEPDMRVRDAFWWDGSLTLLGIYKNTKALYQYDIKTKDIKKLLGESSVLPDVCAGWWRNLEDCQEHHLIYRIDRVDDRFYFLVRYINGISTSYIEFYSACVDEKGVAHIETIFGSEQENRFFTFRDDCFYWAVGGGLWKYDLITQKETKIDDRDCYECVLLGDYLYKRSFLSREVQKTNISEGTDNLLWEVMP